MFPCYLPALFIPSTLFDPVHNIHAVKRIPSFLLQLLDSSTSESQSLTSRDMNIEVHYVTLVHVLLLLIT